LAQSKVKSVKEEEDRIVIIVDGDSFALVEAPEDLLEKAAAMGKGVVAVLGEGYHIYYGGRDVKRALAFKKGQGLESGDSRDHGGGH
jgi:hypothetical protein